mmetsp:Transcript_103772/g.203503  ORF Transcript_103772/g.203503 Transcript_103772/m.203503 type:complete len:560 (+) Transcript_103772:51-1730(+)
MSDVADMLGLSAKPSSGNLASEEAQKIMGEKAKTKGIKKPKGMSREVYDLLGKDGLAPATQANVIAPSFKNKRSNALKGKWVWTHINSSARQNNQPVFFHWIRAEQTYVDYPYASFNVKLDTFSYTDEEYEENLNDDMNWSKEDTDILVNTCHQYDLRWPVISDRVSLSTPRAVEDMQDRYYSVRATLLAKRQEQAGIASAVAAVPTAFNVAQERKRRRAQDMLFKKTKEDEAEESQLREELKIIDAALKKNKKAKTTATVAPESNTNSNTAVGASHAVVTATASLGPGLIPRTILAAPGAGGIADPVAAAAATTSTTSTSGGTGAKVNSATLAEATGAVKRRPALQSSRLYSGTVPPINLTGSLTEYGVTKADTGYVGATLSKKMLNKMLLYLRELEIPENPIPTKDVCDMVEQIKLGTITLLSLHNLIARKERELTALQQADGIGVDATGSKSKPSRTVKKEAGTSAGVKTSQQQQPQQLPPQQQSLEDSAMMVESTTLTGTDFRAGVVENGSSSSMQPDYIQNNTSTSGGGLVKVEGEIGENDISSSAMCVQGAEQ